MDDFYKERAEAIVRARDAGVTYFDIGRAWGITAERVRQIVAVEHARALRIQIGVTGTPLCETQLRRTLMPCADDS